MDQANAAHARGPSASVTPPRSLYGVSTDRPTIVIEEPPETETEAVVAGLGPVVLGGEGRRAGDELAARARRPHRINYCAFANTVIADSLRPSVAPAVIEALPTADRHRLMVTLVRLCGDEADWRKLYGTQLSTDERFFAVTLWHWEREREGRREDVRQHLRLIRGQNASVTRIAGQRLSRLPQVLDRASVAKARPPMKVYDQLLKGSAFTVLSKPNVLLGGSQLNVLIRASSIAHSSALASVLPPAGVSGFPLLADRMKKVTFGSGIRPIPRPSTLQSLDRGGLSGMGDTSRVVRQSGGRAPATALRWPQPTAVGPRRHALGIGHGAEARVQRPGAGLRHLQVGARRARARRVRGVHARVGERPALVPAQRLRDARRPPPGGLAARRGRATLLTALAELVCAGEFTQALRKVIEDAPHLTDAQRDYLDHALEHAEAGDWRQAVPPLLVGLEGALHSAAVAQSLIVVAGGKSLAAEALVKRMAIDDDYAVFVVRRVFGGTGNAFRHGRAVDGERDQVLFGVVALAGWVNYFMQLNAMCVLAAELSKRLDGVIDQGSDGAALLPAPR